MSSRAVLGIQQLTTTHLCQKLCYPLNPLLPVTRDTEYCQPHLSSHPATPAASLALLLCLQPSGLDCSAAGLLANPRLPWLILHTAKAPPSNNRNLMI